MRLTETKDTGSFTVIWHMPEIVDYDGVVLREARAKTFNIPFSTFDIVYYVYKKRKKFVIRKSRVDSIWVTNMCGIRLDNNWVVSEDMFDRVFKENQLDNAIAYCLSMNQKETVKIYNKNSWG